MRNTTVSIFLLIVTFFLFLGCKNDSESNKEVYEIGVIVFRTGGAASYGEKCLNGMDLALKEINSGEGPKIKLLIEDDQTKPEKAVSAFNKLISTKTNVPVYISALTSSSTLAIAPIAESKAKVLFSPCSSSPDITNAGDYIFRNWPSDEVEGQLMMKYALSKGYKKIGIIAINNAYGQGLKKVFERNYTQNGGNIVLESSFSENQTDFKSIIMKFINNDDIDAIYAPSHAKEAGLLIKALRENGYTKEILGCVTYESNDLLVTAGDELSNVAFTTPWFDMSNESSIVQEFSKKYFEKYGSYPDNFSAQSYDAIKIIYNAIIEAGYDAKEIKNYLYTVKNYKGVSGTTSFDKNGDVIKPALLKEVVKGEFRIINEIE